MYSLLPLLKRYRWHAFSQSAASYYNQYLLWLHYTHATRYYRVSRGRCYNRLRLSSGDKLMTEECPCTITIHVGMDVVTTRCDWCLDTALHCGSGCVCKKSYTTHCFLCFCDTTNTRAVAILRHVTFQICAKCITHMYVAMNTSPKLKGTIDFDSLEVTG